jgi:hypothetical protein
VPAAFDGLGWLPNKIGLLCSHYHWSKEYVEDELDGAEGWMWYNVAIERENQRHGGNQIKISGKGYVKQEADRIREQNGRR